MAKRQVEDPAVPAEAEPPAGTASRMSAAELTQALETLGWTVRWLADHTGWAETSVRRWLNDDDPRYPPDDVAEWVRACAEAISRVGPFKQARTGTTLLKVGGKVMTVADAARAAGMSVSTLKYRLRSGWPVERALSEASRIPPRDAGQDAA